MATALIDAAANAKLQKRLTSTPQPPRRDRTSLFHTSRRAPFLICTDRRWRGRCPTSHRGGASRYDVYAAEGGVAIARGRQSVSQMRRGVDGIAASSSAVVGPSKTTLTESSAPNSAVDRAAANLPSMKQFLLSFLFVSAACSSSPASGSASTNSDAATESTQPTDCSPIKQNALELDSSNTCYRPVAEIDGICRQPVSATRTKGLEDVCAAKSGVLYRVLVSTDELLSGEGWTFGPRAAPDVVHQPSTLSAADESRCASAPSVDTASTCHDDAG